MIFTTVLYSEQFDIINEVQDADLSKRLLSSLAVLKRNGRIDIWDMGEAINPGEDRDELIKENLENADVILLLFSPNFLHHVWPTIETQIGEIAEHKKTRIIPILLRPTDLKSTRFRSTQNLPRGDHDSITSAPRSKWDTIFFEISRGIESVITSLEEEKRKTPQDQLVQQNTTRVTQEPQNPNLPSPSQVSPASLPPNATRRALIESIPGDTTMSDTSQSSDIQPNNLRKVLVDSFNKDELQLLCRDIEQDLINDGIDEKVDLDTIGGDGKEIRCQNLIDYLTRRRLLQYLVKAIRRVRPSSI